MKAMTHIWLTTHTCCKHTQSFFLWEVFPLLFGSCVHWDQRQLWALFQSCDCWPHEAFGFFCWYQAGLCNRSQSKRDCRLLLCWWKVKLHTWVSHIFKGPCHCVGNWLYTMAWFWSMGIRLQQLFSQSCFAKSYWKLIKMFLNLTNQLRKTNKQKKLLKTPDHLVQLGQPGVANAQNWTGGVCPGPGVGVLHRHTSLTILIDDTS